MKSETGSPGFVPPPYPFDVPAEVLADLVASVPDPPEEPVVVLQGLGGPDERILTVAWDDLATSVVVDHLTSLFIPRLAAPIAVELQRFAELVAVLRRECPWDADQTHTSLRPHLLEEAHEVLEALDGFDEATGDVLRQIPSEEAVRLARALTGLLVNGKA